MGLPVQISTQQPQAHGLGEPATVAAAVTGAVSLISGAIAKGKEQRLAYENQTRSINAINVELKSEIRHLTNELNKLTRLKADALAGRLGSVGLGCSCGCNSCGDQPSNTGLGLCIIGCKKKKAEEALNAAEKEYERLVAQRDQIIIEIDQVTQELNQWVRQQSAEAASEAKALEASVGFNWYKGIPFVVFGVGALLLVQGIRQVANK